MKTIVKILIGLAIFIGIILIVALFVKKDYILEKETIINKPKQEVFDYVKMLKNQQEFSPWYRMDTTTKMEVRGVDGEVGSVYTWDSEKTGKGEQKTLELVNGESIYYELTFIKPFEGKALYNLYFTEIEPGQTKLRNAFSSSMPYPMNFMLLFMNLENSIGKEMQNGLNNIKEILEKK